ncbi:hypothetical protein AKJ50_00315 [candidate division MSBL1 archaeon SCGC-AAA382A13]|uniref:Nucleotidyl transferase AbiEii/AbiGii toxin family protein n=1 Tax=candidate division MSBL1 archaeon SCGC-AAA382A13 TaxID=1698279 RepID=A0A133VGW3_9EURY|nr:hypothetical protein AKJ50_00315 [candidate division MSBL1 archaeon SCGC-AAA382A13]
MVRGHYIDQIIQLSEQELEKILKAVKPPAALIGGWAVHFHVDDGFRKDQGREYIGSRDIDLGVRVNPSWKQNEIKKKAVGMTLKEIEKLGYTKARFGFEIHYHRETMNRLTEEEARELPMHQIFSVSIDVLPDSEKLKNFEKAFGFHPPAEPLLEYVFEKKRAKALKNYVPWSLPDSIYIPNPEVLAAMKIRSFPDREKGYKRVKDLADLHALLWYTEPYEKIRNNLRKLISNERFDKLENSLNIEIFESTANLLQVETDLIRNTVNRLFEG